MNGWQPLRLFADGPDDQVTWGSAMIEEVNPLLIGRHYLGPISGGKHVLAGFLGPVVVAAMIWRQPTARHLPADGSWLELSRWCLTPEAGPNAGSRMHAFAVRHLKAHVPNLTTLVSYSDPSAGHTGALYKACNWYWAPTWHRLRPPPSGNGSWSGIRQEVKDRWVFDVRRDPQRPAVLAVKDEAAALAFAGQARFGGMQAASTRIGG